MENKIIKILDEFAYNLQEVSPRPIENLEIVLPWDNYKQLKYELSQETLIYNIKDFEVLTLSTISGIKFKVSCKEINESVISEKLQRCFKILTNAQ